MAKYFAKGFKGFVWVFILSILANLAGYATRAILARYLTVSEFGLFFAVFSFIEFLLLFVYFGYPSAITKFVAEYKAKKDHEKIRFALSHPTKHIITISVIVSLLVFFGADILATHYFKSASAVPLLHVFSFLLIGMAVVRSMQFVFRGFQDFAKLGWLIFVDRASFTIFVIVFITAGFTRDTTLATYAFLAATILTLALFLPQTLKYKKYIGTKKHLPDIKKEINHFAIASFLAGIGLFVIGFIDVMLLTYFRTLEEVGIYNTVLPTVMMLSIFSQSIRRIFFPITTELWSKNLKEKLASGVLLLRRYALIGIIPLSLILFVFPKRILALLFGQNYITGHYAMQILALGMIFFTLNGIYQTTLLGIGKPKEVTKIIAIGAIFNFVLNLLLIPRHGIEGAALTTALTYVLTMLLFMKKLNQFVKLNFQFTIWIKSLFVILFLIITTYRVKDYLHLNIYVEATLIVIIAGTLYFILCYLLNLISFKELKTFAQDLNLWKKTP
jgi:O-antigen/teichoic acid export membrane protein